MANTGIGFIGFGNMAQAMAQGLLRGGVRVPPSKSVAHRVLIAAALALLGSLIVEFFTEHRHLKVCLPQLADKLRAAKPGELAGCIERSGLLRRQKRALTELLNHPALTADMREPLAPADDDYSQVWDSAAI